jgi:TPR repeat protein
MEFVFGAVGLVVVGFVVATLWGLLDGGRLYVKSLKDPNEVHKMGVESWNRGDIKAAVLRFRHASEMGHAGSAFNIGIMLLNGVGTNQNAAEAFRWFKISADRGLAQGQLNVGSLYMHGAGVEKDPAKAHHYLKLAADQGLEPAIELFAALQAKS